jgi:DNA polymerase IV
MDSFFVEVERLRDPSLVGRPVAVGGAGPRGVIASASYEARRFGVHSAQPTGAALRMCPDLEIVPPAHGRYSEVSAQVFVIFRSFTPLVEGLSLDEAFLDATGLRHHYASSTAVGEAIRESLRVELQLPASVGIASTKFIAKLASEEAKPDGLMHVAEDTQLEFLHELGAKSLWGVGPATLAGLERLGVETVGDIAEMPESALVSALGPTLGRHLHNLANGIDPRRIEPDIGAKSISVEQTYESDLEGVEVIEAALLAHAQRLSGRLRRSGLSARTITLKARYDDFSTVTRSQTLDGATDGSHHLYSIGLELLGGVDVSRPVRLLGLGGSSLEETDEPRQLGFDDSEEWNQVEEAIAQVREKYGDRAVSPARLLERANSTSSKEQG